MYKPKNVVSFRNNSTEFSPGSSIGKGPAMVPGATGSDDRESEKNFIGNGDHENPNQQHGQDYNILGNENSPRNNPTMGRRSYGAETPSL